MLNQTTAITAETASWVLNYFGQGGYEPGGFTSKLMTAIGHADMWNLDRLAMGFPELVAAMKLAMHTDDGIARLRLIAGAAA